MIGYGLCTKDQVAFIDLVWREQYLKGQMPTPFNSCGMYPFSLYPGQITFLPWMDCVVPADRWNG